MTRTRFRYIRTFAMTVLFVAQLAWLKYTRFLRGARQERAASRLYTRQARRFVRFAITMGGLIVKLGQFMSVRIDLLPKEYIDELSQLQDSLPPVPTPRIIATIEAELSHPLRRLYGSFDPTPLAAASLGQVHRATLPDGTAVAVKVLRPGIEQLVTTDLRSLRAVLRLVNRWLHIDKYTDLSVLDADFTATFTNELDYQLEGRNAEAFQRNCLLNPHVDIPKIYWDWSTKRVLTMEFMDGIRIDDLAGIDAAGIDRPTLATNLGGLFFQMVLTDGFYHADPHPGNVLVRSDGVIQLIDFGMVGSVTAATRAEYERLVLGLVRRDAVGIVRSLKALHFLGPGADTARLTEMIEPYIDAIVGDVANFYTGRSIVDSVMSGHVSLTIDPAALTEIQQFIYTQPITLPGQTTFLGKALITVIGLTLRLDPAMDLIGTATPYVTGDSPFQVVYELLEKAGRDGFDLVKGMVPTARHLMSVATKLDDGTLEVELSRSVERRLAEGQKRQTRTIVRLILGCTAVLTAVQLRRR
ncbi:MAG: hypothetical protein LBI33_14080 [Propionibacteriaceae bacterium]|jgi:predicted unusual protein kinase regulating ubiquinone biosynthesis (AarF/ABC1/UbiB family)|nr:hypothetical protein [Propionibacteriaceae bacterium]